MNNIVIVFSLKKEIERMVALCDEEGYLVPRGLTREEKRMFILNSAQKEGVENDFS